MNPTQTAQTAVSASALLRVLNALEQNSPATLRRLARDTGLGITTVTRAVREAVRMGILGWDEGTDPESGRPCRVAVPASAAILPVLCLTRGRGSVLAVDMALRPLGAAVTELNPAVAPEENLRLLCRRGMTLLRGCAKVSGLAVAAPVLLTEDGIPHRAALSEAVTDAMGVSPSAIAGYGEAVARGVYGEPLPEGCTSLLFLRVGEGNFACLLLRDQEKAWVVSPLGRGLTATLARCLRSSGNSAEALRRGIAGFLTDLCRFVCPDLILIEDTRGILPSAENRPGYLPEGVQVILRTNDTEALTAAERGAALLGRRVLWDRILERSWDK